jgi:signal-transduction protein with cAMP-binding, CBS, and nucleotidyltransferase domain
MNQEALGAVAAEDPEVGRAFADFCHRRMVANLLRTSPVLSVLSEKERTALMSRFVARTYDKNEPVIAQGDTGQGLHLIASGGVVVSRTDGDDRVVIARLGVGEAVGEVAMVLRRPANADVIAEHPTVTMHLPEDGFMDLVRSHPSVLAQLYELAIRRDEETSSIVAQDASEAGDLII